MITCTWLLILALAAFRVTRLVIEDSILDPIRNRTIYVWPDHGIGGWMKDLFSCPWCIGFWISVDWSVSFYFWPTTTWWVALPFAISAVVGLAWRATVPHS